MEDRDVTETDSRTRLHGAVDLDDGGAPIGIEITAPSITSAAELDALLLRLGQTALERRLRGHCSSARLVAQPLADGAGRASSRVSCSIARVLAGVSVALVSISM
jgi:hypothetical protein